MLTQRLRELQVRVGALHDFVKAQCKEIETDISLSAEAWPDDQVVGLAEWHSRDETPPKGIIWASDGSAVWLLHHCDGKPISKDATRVRYWTRAFIPAPPAP